MDNVKRLIKPNGHFIQNRKTELIVGALMFVIGALFLWDAWNGRGKNAPWPLGGILPF